MPSSPNWRVVFGALALAGLALVILGSRRTDGPDPFEIDRSAYPNSTVETRKRLRRFEYALVRTSDSFDAVADTYERQFRIPPSASRNAFFSTRTLFFSGATATAALSQLREAASNAYAPKVTVFLRQRRDRFMGVIASVGPREESKCISLIGAKLAGAAANAPKSSLQEWKYPNAVVSSSGAGGGIQSGNSYSPDSLEQVAAFYKELLSDFAQADSTDAKNPEAKSLLEGETAAEHVVEVISRPGFEEQILGSVLEDRLALVHLSRSEQDSNTWINVSLIKGEE